MAATLVGEAFLSATVQILVEQLASPEFHDYFRTKKISVSLLEELETILLALQKVLDDAEQKQIVDNAVKHWLDRLKDAIFNAEDLLNEIKYDALRRKVESAEAKSITTQVWDFVSSPIKNTCGDINSQMKDMCERLQRFANQKDTLGLQTASGRASRRTPSSSLVNESVMVGREDDKEKLRNMLLSDGGTSSNNNIGIVAILGMGGVGKTTLAQLLYNDTKVQDHFDLKAWASVSEDFDLLSVTKTLLESVTSKTWETNNLDLLRVELKQNLRDKRFLFVLDDLWNDRYTDWDELVTPLIYGKSGSMVIITTRQQKVAEVTRTFPIHKLELLSDEDCWSLLSKHAFGNEDLHDGKHSNLEAIGWKIAKKCGGLPIAAKTVGGLLRSKVDAKEWTAILNSNIWELPNDDILPALLLSYQYLPSPLKRCFAYCSIFPKDYPLCRKQLVLLWMAEGFLEESKGERAAEEVGDDYFVELLSRSLIQQSNDDYRGEKFVMHDLVLDLAMIVSGKSSCRLECSKIYENVRHLSYNLEGYDIFKKFEICHKFKCLRSFLSFHPSYVRGYLSRKVVDDLIPALKRLRVLSLSSYTNITVLPDSIGSLVQLRYLDLSYTGIKNLPNTTCNLYNLQTLLLSCCEGLTELPIHIGKLVNLRHLDISETSIKEMPTQIVELQNLQTLNVFVVGKQEAGLRVKELRKFPHLQGKLSIKNLCNVIDAMEACDANLKGKEQIEELVLEWSTETEDSQKEKVVLDMLQPSINLKKLTIDSYGGTSFPSWLGDSSFSNMVYLSIHCCKYCVTLPPLGQLPSLKDLRVTDGRILETIGPEFYGSSSQPFQSLEHLIFSNMSNWKEWLPFESCKFPFPRLKTLKLDSCPQLRGHLPNHLPSLEEFRLIRCYHLLATPPSLHWLSSIKKITIESESTERTQCSLLGSDSPCLLQEVTMWSCYMPLSLPKMILSSTCLQSLELFYIPSLSAFPADGLPTSLMSLGIFWCENLAFPPPETWSNYTSLVSLYIKESCNSLTSFPLDGFPSLRSLHIEDCSSLESIFVSESSSLRPSSLQTLQVHCCHVLRSLPQRMDTLIALECLRLKDLPKLEWSFSEGARLPSKLKSIMIHYLPPTPITEWGLQGLIALSDLSIQGDDVVNALLKEQLLPTSLVSLSIRKLLETKSLEGNGLRHLSSLEDLTFRNCPRLESLPKDTLPSSLETLEFEDCPRLQPLPAKDSLPSSLTLLCIGQCPLLEARYESQRGEHWSNIAHIPVIKINGKVII